jgi:hypothetical protein
MTDLTKQLEIIARNMACSHGGKGHHPKWETIGRAQELHKKGLTTRQIATLLDQEGFLTYRGGPWRTDSVRDLLKYKLFQGEQTKDPRRIASGRKAGLKGGKIRAARLTPKQRSEIARQGGLANGCKRRALLLYD